MIVGMKTLIFYSKEMAIGTVFDTVAKSLNWPFFHYQELDNFNQLQDLIHTQSYSLVLYAPSYKETELKLFLSSLLESKIAYQLITLDPKSSNIALPISRTSLLEFLQK